MRGVLLALLLLGMTLAGCTEEKDDAPADEPAEASFAPVANTTTPAPAPNAAPAITAFTANATGLNVTFQFNATDAENGTLSYVLAFGGNLTNATGALANGTANVTQPFPAAGLYNVTLIVSDGNRSSNQTLSLNLTSLVGPEEEFTCTVDLPAVVVSISGLPVAFGACVFTETSVQTLLVIAEPAPGCTIRLDENLEDTTAGPVVEQGSVNPAGQYGMRCDIQGPSVGGEGRIVIQAV